MLDYYVDKNLRIRSYEFGYVVEKRRLDEKKVVHWSGVLWYSTAMAAIRGVSEYLVRKSKKPLPEALLDAAEAYKRTLYAVITEEQVREPDSESN